MPIILASPSWIASVPLAALALPVEMNVIAPLGGGDEFDEIGAAMPRGLRRQGGAGQQHAARIDAARAEEPDGLAQAVLAVVIVLEAADQPHLVADAEKPRERAQELAREGEDARTAPALAESKVQRERAAIAEADQHDPARIEPKATQLPVEQGRETTGRALEHRRI